MLEGKLSDGVHVCESMKDAVEKAMFLSKKGSAVLFSPAFSSFGMFSSYSERGKSFKNEVLCLKNLKK
jgi:UDP-N-acetylmuramoylalanine-D-glutamate ligase